MDVEIHRIKTIVYSPATELGVQVGGAAALEAPAVLSELADPGPSSALTPWWVRCATALSASPSQVNARWLVPGATVSAGSGADPARAP